MIKEEEELKQPLLEYEYNQENPFKEEQDE